MPPTTATDPAAYEAWYQSRRGRWISDIEYKLIRGLLRPAPGASLLDVGCGTGHFSRRFAAAGLTVTGLDPDPAMLDYARSVAGGISFIRSSALHLPFPDNSFDYSIAVTSLCFITEPEPALQELRRVTRRAVALGLLNRHSLLYVQKHGKGGYRGARWDTPAATRQWCQALQPVVQPVLRSGVYLPGGGGVARAVERLCPSSLLLGGFLAAGLE